MSNKLNKIAKQLVAPGKGILAADESFRSIEKKLAKINLPSTEESRRNYREMFFSTPGIGEYISGVIMFDETLRQKSASGESFVELLEKQGIIPGIKVDLGTKKMLASPEETLTMGLEGLAGRLAEYAKLRAKFTKWRAVITIGERIPTNNCIQENTERLAKYAKLSQDASLVPIVEPEVLMDGAHDIRRSLEVTKKTLKAVFEALRKEGVSLQGMLLKPNMVMSGLNAPIQASPQEVARNTVDVLKEFVPAEVPGIVFLSGGVGDIKETVYLNEINKLDSAPWPLSFSFGRALQDAALKTWQGKKENVVTAQKVFYHRAKMSSIASQGKYDPKMEAV